MGKVQSKGNLLQEHLIRTMELLDGQIAREMQRTPQQRNEHGVTKWQPYEKRVEQTTTMILQSLGTGETDLDSLLVLARAFSKALFLFSDELGTEGLGKMRSGYAAAAAEEITKDMERALQILGQRSQLLT